MVLDATTTLRGPTVGPQKVAGSARRPRVVLAVVVSLALYVGCLHLEVGHPYLRTVASDLAIVVAPLLASLACWTAHRRTTDHTGWAWLAVGCLTWASGSVVWTFYELVLGRLDPFPSWADVGFVGYALPVMIGLTRFPVAPGQGWSRGRLYLDGVVIGSSMLLCSSIWVLQSVVDATTMTWTRLVALSYPLAAVAVAAIVLSRFLTLPDTRRRVWLPLSFGLLTLVVVDSVYIARTFAGDYHTGGILDAGWLIAFALVGIAAWSPDVGTARPPADNSSTIVRQLLPYGTMALAAIAMVSEPPALSVDGPYLWLVLPLMVAAVVRQVLVGMEHASLVRHMSEAVDRRTVELQHREQWWSELVRNLSDVVMVIDPSGGIRYCSPSAKGALGYWAEPGSTAQSLIDHVHPDDASITLAAIEPVATGALSHGFVECRVQRGDDSWAWFEVTAVGRLDEEALEGTVLTLHDVSERRQLTDQLTHEAYHDALTGLPNRAALMQRIEDALARRTQEPPALVLLDLDDFKVINDRHGHAAGDLVLEVIGRRLKQAVRSDDVVARLGGDEFALLLAGTPAQVQRTAERVIDDISLPVVAGGRSFMVRASAGIVFAADDDAETPHSMLSHADIALYQAKGRGKGGIVVIAGDERDAAAKQVHLREQIAQPDLEQFAVVYQPLIDLNTGAIRGVEALLRWNHPDLGLVTPDTFIPMAEAGGSITRLGWFVLDDACANLARWQRQVPGHRLAVGVNLSSLQLDEPGFVDGVSRVIAEHGLDPGQVVLELTEQSLSLDFEMAVQVVAELRAIGVSVAVDDYGTGYSSLRYLHRFAADVVKIDRSFIANLEGSPHTQKIVRSVMEMSFSLDLQTIAEGIETPGQLELVRLLGCELGQGFLFSRPVEPAEITTMLLSGEPLFPVAPHETAPETPPETPPETSRELRTADTSSTDPALGSGTCRSPGSACATPLTASAPARG